MVSGAAAGKQSLSACMVGKRRGGGGGIDKHASPLSAHCVLTRPIKRLCLCECGCSCSTNVCPLLSCKEHKSSAKPAEVNTSCRQHVLYVYALSIPLATASPFWLLMLPASMFLVFDWSTWGLGTCRADAGCHTLAQDRHDDAACVVTLTLFDCSVPSLSGSRSAARTAGKADSHQVMDTASGQQPHMPACLVP